MPVSDLQTHSQNYEECVCHHIQLPQKSDMSTSSPVYRSPHSDAAAYTTKTNTQYTDTYTDTAVTKSFAKSKTKKVSKKTKTKHITVAKLNGTTLKYHKSTMNTNLKGNSDWEWENIVGYGKKKSIKVAKNCKYYILGNDIHTVKKTTKKKFQKRLYSYKRYKENGVIWYWGTAAKITIKNGKVIKMVQEYQS